MDVYAQQRILLLFDAFEHNLDDTGAICSETLSRLCRRIRRKPALLEAADYDQAVPIVPGGQSNGACRECRWNRGLPVSDGIALLESQSPGGITNRTHVEAAIKAVDGIPFAVQRMASPTTRQPPLEVRSAAVREGPARCFQSGAHPFDAQSTRARDPAGASCLR